MQLKCSTNIEINKVTIDFTNKNMTAYGRQFIGFIKGHH